MTSKGDRKCFDGLTTVNVELTSRCNKACWMCGRRKVERDYPELAMDYGDMDFALVERIARQLPSNMVVQLHNNGEALLYPNFGQAVDLFAAQITNIVTNGKLLVEKADEIVGKLDTLAISIIENDPEAGEQRKIVEEFLRIKGEANPYTILRLNGAVDKDAWRDLGLPMATRNIHSPMGSYAYQNRGPTIPEVGFCLDFMNHLAIDRRGQVSICVRFDPERLGVIGDAASEDLVDIWNSPRRLGWMRAQVAGKRASIPLCARCEFWGVPTGWGDEYESGVRYDAQ